MIIVTNEGDFLFRCDEQTKQEIDEHIDYKKLYRQISFLVFCLCVVVRQDEP